MQVEKQLIPVPRQQGLPERVTGGPEVSDGPQPNRQADRPEERGPGLDVNVGLSDGGGLETGVLSMFPPEPGDFAQWRETLDQRPELKPSLHRLDDGLAFGLDRSSAAGNGVVPMAAARAWQLLTQHHALACS